MLSYSKELPKFKMNLNNRKILITGAAGFVGSNLLRTIIKRYPEAKITIVVKPSTDLWRIKDLVNKVSILKTDLLNKSLLTKKMRVISPDVIFHLVTLDYHQDSLNNFINVNTLGTLNLIFALEDIDYKVFINTGTSSEYGAKTHPFSEEDSLSPDSFYAATKAVNTILLDTYSKIKSKPIITIRPFSIYGPYEMSGRLISANIIKALNNQPIILAKEKVVMDFVYIDDLVELYLKAASIKKTDIRVINASSGKGTSIEEVVVLIKRITKSSSTITKEGIQRSSWHNVFWVGSNKRAEKVLGWKVRFSLEEGLIKTIKWFKQNKNLYE